jgi:hypothetical protein
MTRTSLILTALLLSACAPASAGAAPARAEGFCPRPPWVVDGTQADGRYGTIAPAGDVNRDGYADVIVGCYNCSNGQTNEGIVRLYLGGPSGLSTTASWSAESNQAGAQMADKLSTAGDVNGDGYDDVVVGAAFYDHGLTDQGAAFLYLGGPSGLAASPAWTTYGELAGANYGACSQGAGDVNGDGYDDVIIGSWLYGPASEPFEGRAYLYLGSPTGLSTTPAWIGESHSANAVYGYFCTGAGDLNGDGYGDVVVGARRFSGNGLSKEGRVYVYYGSPTGLHAAADWIQDGGQPGGEFGESVSTAGDVNHDGYGDLVVSAFRYDDPETDEGKGYVFMGSASGLSHTPAWTTESNQAGAYWAYHVDTAGDTNGDGYDDVVMSASQYDIDGFTDAGLAFLYLGGPAGLDTIPDWVQHGDEDGGGLGNSVRGVGDVDGDGFTEVGTGALYHDIGTKVDAGRAYVFYGCAHGPLAVGPERVRALELAAASANPFASRLRLRLMLPAEAAVSLAIRDVQGREIAVLHAGVLAAGPASFEWDGRIAGGASAPAGVYYAQLRTPFGRRSARLVKLN